ncbi:hypothetical protein A6E92_28445 [Streptomyces sp. S8]|uniref:SAM-dependent methyltransferase n=1 Tax=Streptomyces sp. S8 TaxID=1837283 RepID=UPI000A094C43|nr:class I SAM-dependent methyltransferase [Streptomyces sp. S8]ARI55656.1 hypothetical protein A6E92_28445 [Streptomyces sp. S8]
MHCYEDDALWPDFAPMLFPHAREQPAAALVVSSPLLDFPPGSRVLDLACGPGLFVVPLAARGYTVTGVDLSPLERARTACEAAGAEVRLERADMLTYTEPGAFDMILNVFTSFGCFECFEAAEDSLFEEAALTDVECLGGADGPGYGQHSDRLVVRGRRK